MLDESLPELVDPEGRIGVGSQLYRVGQLMADECLGAVVWLHYSCRQPPGSGHGASLDGNVVVDAGR